MSKLSVVRSVKLKLLAVLVVVVLAAGASMAASPAAAALPQASITRAPITTVALAQCQQRGFFGLTPWWGYMPNAAIDGNCDVKCFNVLKQKTNNDCGTTNSDIPGVLLAIIDDLLRIAGLVAVGFVLVGAFQYVASRGNPERTAGAQSAIINALVGLVIAMAAVGFISFLGSKL